MEGITSSPPMGQINSSSHSIFTPLLISMLGIVGTSFAILFYHFFLVKYCMTPHTTTTDADQTTTAVGESPPPTGIDKKVLETIPIFPFSDVKLNDDFSTECVVCLGELEDEDFVRLLPNCKHAFHVHCIDQWLEAHDSCPVCRSKIVAVTSNDDVSDSLSSLRIDSTSSTNYGSITIDRGDTIRSCGLLRHCASLVLTRPVDRQRSIVGLKRSLSMDQSFISINLQRESGIIRDNYSFSSLSIAGGELTRIGSGTTTRSLNQFDRMSYRLLRSFGRLRIGKGNSATILPY